jgi:hypothetical protein
MKRVADGGERHERLRAVASRVIPAAYVLAAARLEIRQRVEMGSSTLIFLREPDLIAPEDLAVKQACVVGREE